MFRVGQGVRNLADAARGVGVGSVMGQSNQHCPDQGRRIPLTASINPIQTDHSQLLLQAVLESIVDGVLVFSEDQELTYANSIGRRLYAELRPHSAVGQEIQRLCQALIDLKTWCPDRAVTLDSEVRVHTLKLTVSGCWFQFGRQQIPSILIRFHHHGQSSMSLGLAEATQWGLTAQETDVWLLRRSGCSRAQIASRLQTSFNIVTYTLSMIQRKRRAQLAVA